MSWLTLALDRLEILEDGLKKESLKDGASETLEYLLTDARVVRDCLRRAQDKIRDEGCK